MRKVLIKTHHKIASCFSKDINFSDANAIKVHYYSCILILSCLRAVINTPARWYISNIEISKREAEKNKKTKKNKPDFISNLTYAL